MDCGVSLSETADTFFSQANCYNSFTIRGKSLIRSLFGLKEDLTLTSKSHVAVEEASLEDEAQYAGAAHPLLLPPCHKGNAVTMASFSSQPDSTGCRS